MRFPGSPRPDPRLVAVAENIRGQLKIMPGKYQKVTIVGCGAMGSLLAAGLAEVDCELTVIDRGRQFEAIKHAGISVIGPAGQERHCTPARVVDHFNLAPQDLVILAVKTHQISAIAVDVAGLLGESSALISLQNGIPWWYFGQHHSRFPGQVLEAVDPGGTIAAAIPGESVIGCVAYPAATVETPGVTRHVEGYRFPVGAAQGGNSEHVQAASSLLEQAGFKAPVLENLRGEVWLKLWGALAFNPLSMLTRATMYDIATHPPTRQLVIAMMREAQDIAAELGVKMRVPLEKRLAGAEKVGAHKTSALQDLERGEATELDALLGSVIELGRLTGMPTNNLQAVYAACSLLEKGSCTRT